jgi:hypothetical protein
MITSRLLATGVSLLAILGGLAPAASVFASDASREEQPDPRMAGFCLFLGGSVDQCLGYLRPEGR